MTGERDGEPERQRRLGNLWVFWPALLSWGSVAAWLWTTELDWFLESAPDWLRSVRYWTMLSAVVFAVVGAIFVTSRYRKARHWFPIVLNLTTVFPPYVYVALAVELGA